MKNEERTVFDIHVYPSRFQVVRRNEGPPRLIHHDMRPRIPSGTRLPIEEEISERVLLAMERAFQAGKTERSREIRELLEG